MTTMSRTTSSIITMAVDSLLDDCDFEDEFGGDDDGVEGEGTLDSSLDENEDNNNKNK